MEELLLDFIKYGGTFLGGMIFTLILDIFVSMDKTGDKEREQRDKDDARQGILRGKEASRFHNKAEERQKGNDEAYERGKKAWREDGSSEDCPYPDGSIEEKVWLSGFLTFDSDTDKGVE